MLLFRTIWLLFAVMACVPPARGETAILTAQRDTTLYQHDGSRSNGAGSILAAGTNAMGSPRRGLLGFDVAGSIPPGSTVESVQLTLHVARFSGAGDPGTGDPTQYVTGLHALSRSWGEGTAGAGSGVMGVGQGFVTVADGSSATWTHAFYDTEAWSTPGGDFVAVSSASTLVSGIIDAAVTWESTPALIADVQGWLDDPAANFGWILLGDETTAATIRNFYSREAAEAALRPALVVTYVPIPEPSVWPLLAAGVLGLAGSWRRARLHSTAPA